MRAKLPYAFASVLIGAVAALSAPADAACKKFGFTVNDYGKDGPTNDAKNLLDKHIAEWAAQNKITEFQTGKKSVSCELFLDVVLFDEHTCTASATVCWGADAKKLGAQSAAAPADGAAGAPTTPVRKAHAGGHTKQAATSAATATPAAAAAPAETAAPAAPAVAESTAPAAADAGAPAYDAAPTQAIEQITSPAETPAAAPAVHTTTAPAAAPASSAPAQVAAPSAGGTTGAVVDTGALPAEQVVPPQAQKRATTVVSEKDRAAAASAAASAAAAAERAAVAAETAANAAKEAAAAAVAASAASKGAKPVHNE